MRRITLPCPFCHGEKQLEEFPCPCCLGEGTLENEVCDELPKLERPRHEKVFNATPEYAMRKALRQKCQSERNQVVLGILGLSDFKASTDEQERAT